jgi:DNA-binding transcriptional LysR family regulator
MLDFKSLETFLWVANLRSFRGAAEKLNTTQPAVSMRIAQLEDLLGVRLLERDRRVVAPTPKGQELIGYAERMMRLRAEMLEAVGDRSAMRGIVRLGCSETIVHTWLPTLIERVNAAYPNLELEIEVDITPNLRERLAARDLDIALLLGPIGDPHIHSRPLCAFPLAFMAGKQVKLPKEAVGLEQIATVVRMALDGIGIAVIPPAILDNVAGVSKLRTVNTAVKLPSLNFVVAWLSSPDSIAAQKVADIAQVVARQQG